MCAPTEQGINLITQETAKQSLHTTRRSSGQGRRPSMGTENGALSISHKLGGCLQRLSRSKHLMNGTGLGGGIDVLMENEQKSRF